MLFRGTSFLLGAIGIGGVSAICLPCGVRLDTDASATSEAARAADTVTVRYRISGMTCATCHVTARVALEKTVGVYRATVSFADSLGVVWYDPRRTTPSAIAAELKRLTGYQATVVPDTARDTARARGGAVLRQ